MTAPTLSFEFFPPKSEESAEALQGTARQLTAVGPSFMTVTFGAGGSTREGTLKTLRSVQGVTKIPLGAHLTYICMTKTELATYLDTLREMGVTRLVALRGDMPPGQEDVKWPLDDNPDYYQYTSDFVAGIKAHDSGFEINVGAYPEKHPDAPDLDFDIQALKKKCDAGADRAITQFFFNNDSFYRFVDKTAAAGIRTPIVPGILPIVSYKNMLRFANTCQAHVPDALKARFETADEADHPAIARDVLLSQVEDLRKNGVGHFHFYTLNRAEMVLDACGTLSIVTPEVSRQRNTNVGGP